MSKEFNKPIAVIDSKNVSAGMGLTVLRVAKAIEDGAKFDEIVNKVDKWVSDSKIFVSVKTLKYMVNGGRVSPLKGLLAKIMNVKPIVSMDENGKSILFGKTFSQQASLKKIYKHIQKINRGKTVWNYILLHAHNPEGAAKAEEKMLKLTGKSPVSLVNISPVIGMHAGHGAIAIALLYN